jgi:hypothetical protein
MEEDTMGCLPACLPAELSHTAGHVGACWRRAAHAMICLWHDGFGGLLSFDAMMYIHGWLINNQPQLINMLPFCCSMYVPAIGCVCAGL